MKSQQVSPLRVLRGRARVPGDKSISHRAVMLGAIAEGTSRVKGFLAGDDPLATVAAFSQMGVVIERVGPTELLIHGAGSKGLRPPTGPIDVGNSGTTIRLMTGLLCAQPFASVLDGDASIRRRPMKRVMAPLAQMGARIVDADGAGHAPLKLHGVASGERLKAIAYESPVASAQVKSAVLLAGLYADGRTCVGEPAPSRDHTERMLAHMGVKLERSAGRVCIEGGQRLKAADVDVPADISSAAFFIVAALLADEGEIVLENVGVNPTRDGIIEALQGMGADISIENARQQSGEPAADLRIRPSLLKGTSVGGSLVPRMIDELPVFAVAACFADGETVIADAEELRVKESDRIVTMQQELAKLGIEVEAREDGMRIVGDPKRRLRGGRVNSHGDHRVAMSLAVSATRADGAIDVEDVECVDTSFPGFFGLLRRLSS